MNDAIKFKKYKVNRKNLLKQDKAISKLYSKIITNLDKQYCGCNSDCVACKCKKEKENE